LFSFFGLPPKAGAKANKGCGDEIAFQRPDSGAKRRSGLGLERGADAAMMSRCPQAAGNLDRKNKETPKTAPEPARRQKQGGKKSPARREEGTGMSTLQRHNDMVDHKSVNHGDIETKHRTNASRQKASKRNDDKMNGHSQ
jgi:hypothetical protein